MMKALANLSTSSLRFSRIRARRRHRNVRDSSANARAGGTPCPTGECEECRKKGMKLQRKGTQPSTLASQPSEIPPIVHEALAHRASRSIHFFGRGWKQASIAPSDRFLQPGSSLCVLLWALFRR